jgi:MOSC domain-containing protein YiiM
MAPKPINATIFMLSSFPRIANRLSWAIKDRSEANIRFEPHLRAMAFHPQSSLAKLLDAPVRPGRVIWLGLRPERRAEMTILQAIELERARGVVGDRYQSPDGARQVTLIGLENLRAIEAYLGRDTPISPGLVRRNIVVAGLNLLALKDRRFRIGEASLETSGECHPCSRME